MPAPGARKAAKLARQLHYFTGQPCKNGHTADRLTSNCSCVVCILERGRLPENRAKAAARRARNADKRKGCGKIYAAEHRAQKAAYDKLYRARNHDKKIAQDRAYYWANRNRRLAAASAWYRANRSYALARGRLWRRNNPEKVRAYWDAWEMRRELRILRAWLARY